MAVVEDTIKVLGFVMNEQMFALDISKVKEVVEYGDLTFVPKAPECAMGVFNYHGKVITVVDLAKFFNIESADVTPDTRIVILAGDDYSLGFCVDRADKIENVSKDALQAPKESASDKGFVGAVVRVEDRLYNLLDPETLLDAIEEEFSAANLR